MKKKQGKKPSSAGAKKVNPFELKFNRHKHDILGKKKLASVGAPTASRKRAHEQREKTLGIEYERAGKISKITDKRLGEKENKTDEEKSALRFAEERTKNYKKASKFNLTDDFEDGEDLTLTHGGRLLSDIEKYDKSMVSDDDDDDDPGNIGAQMVKVAHFGGGEQSTEEKVKDQLSRKDFISEMIARTKVARHEKQAAKDEMETLTESLDEKYHALMGRVHNAFRPVGATKAEKVDKDDYDKLALSLKIDADSRATPAERTKTEDELAVGEKERLEMLEAQRVARMNSKKNKNSHISADMDVDIDAGAKADARKEKKKAGRFAVAFDEEGTMHDKNKVEKSSIKRVAIDSDDEDDLSGAGDDDDEDLDDLIDDEEDEEGDDEEDDEEDVDEEEEDEDEDDEDEVIGKKGTKVAQKIEDKSEDTSIPFVFQMPKNYNKLLELLQDYPNEKMNVVFERIVKCHHPGLKEGNKQLLNKFFVMLLRLFDDLAKEPLNEQILNEMAITQKWIYNLRKFDVQFAVRCVRALIRQHWKAIREKEKGKPATFALISLMKLVTVLFPTSDNWHPVCTPAFFLATEALSRVKIVDVLSLARQTLLATTLATYVTDSKKYIPELMSFVRSALLLAVKDKPTTFSAPGFPVSEPHCQMLCIDEDIAKNSPTGIQLGVVFGEAVVDDQSKSEHRVPVLRALLSLVQTLRVLYSAHSETFTVLFMSIVRTLKAIDSTNLPEDVRDELEALTTSTEAECKAKSRISQMSLVKTEKSMLRMLEPRFEWDFDAERPRKGRDTTRKGSKGEAKKLQQEVKKEMRGAVKELRKDTAFLARKQLSTVKAKDRDRRQKVKRLMGGLMEQQGEWNKELRESGKKPLKK